MFKLLHCIKGKLNRDWVFNFVPNFQPLTRWVAKSILSQQLLSLLETVHRKVTPATRPIRNKLRVLQYNFCLILKKRFETFYHEMIVENSFDLFRKVKNRSKMAKQNSFCYSCHVKSISHISSKFGKYTRSLKTFIFYGQNFTNKIFVFIGKSATISDHFVFFQKYVLFLSIESTLNYSTLLCFWK